VIQGAVTRRSAAGFFSDGLRHVSRCKAKPRSSIAPRGWFGNGGKSRRDGRMRSGPGRTSACAWPATIFVEVGRAGSRRLRKHFAAAPTLMDGAL